MDGRCESINEGSRDFGLSSGGWEKCGRRKISGTGMWDQEFIFGQVKNEVSIRSQVIFE